MSEEDSPITILAPAEQSFNWPNKITLADFNDWVEQRGSKFFTTWDKAYTPMISTFDKGQPPQSGGWLMARYGKGHWMYFVVHGAAPSVAVRRARSVSDYGEPAGAGEDAKVEFR